MFLNLGVLQTSGYLGPPAMVELAPVPQVAPLPFMFQPPTLSLSLQSLKKNTPAPRHPISPYENSSAQLPPSSTQQHLVHSCRRGFPGSPHLLGGLELTRTSPSEALDAIDCLRMEKDIKPRGNLQPKRKVRCWPTLGYDPEITTKERRTLSTSTGVRVKDSEFTRNYWVYYPQTWALCQSL